LLPWYRNNGRDLPWRRTRDPYAILVSEFMLQQTQVATVIPYYERWLKRFPDFASLARADESDVLHAWQGLGYYTRARNLHTTAKIVTREYGGEFPNAITVARTLPGIGEYTANAVATFARDMAVPIVEANIARVLARLTNLRTPVDSAAGKQKLWSIAADLVPAQNAGVFNSALMELGALLCKPQPHCSACPVHSFCRAKDPQRLPVKRPKRSTVRMTEHHGFAFRRGRILLEQSQHRWRGMWILPRLTTLPQRDALHVSRFPFTHHQITLAISAGEPQPDAHLKRRWFGVKQIALIPIPSPHRRALHELLASTAQ
jgi:A/G-specific adenine glycosylase